MTQHICLWSGPRNVSTALMYSFAQRDDVRVVDEPLYGHYLRVSQAPHPGSDDVQRAMNCDGNAVMRELLQRPTSARLFLKHMAHHLVDLDLGFLERTCNVFLIRDPREMLPSLHIQLPDARLADTSLKQQWELFSDLSAVGRIPRCWTRANCCWTRNRYCDGCVRNSASGFKSACCSGSPDRERKTVSGRRIGTTQYTPAQDSHRMYPSKASRSNCSPC